MKEPKKPNVSILNLVNRANHVRPVYCQLLEFVTKKEIMDKNLYYHPYNHFVIKLMH